MRHIELIKKNKENKPMLDRETLINAIRNNDDSEFMDQFSHDDRIEIALAFLDNDELEQLIIGWLDTHRS